MIVTKKAISRRTVLGGIGATVSLPLLDAMIPALTASQKTPAKAVRRLGIVYHPNGVVYENWLPKGVGTEFELSPILAPLQPFPQALSLDPGHHVVQEIRADPARARDLARIDQSQDVGVLEVGGDADLAQEPFGAEHGSELGMQHLECHGAIVLEILRQVDRGHPAASKLTLDGVAAGEAIL